jgi:nucleotidyltransferase substrate binding protein (TIGR01987 family)
MTDDFCWKQRLQNWNRALAQLTKFMQCDALNELEELGLIHSFEYNHELAWNTQKDFLQDQGFTGLFCVKDVAKKAFEVGLIKNGELWLDMIKNRNLASHTYNDAITRQVVDAIVHQYFAELSELNTKLNEVAEKDSC